ncbi:MAG: T9SS type A sorting domain-containing protein [Salinivirgaceae bacterium]|nr:T9SS type A sorting domain-containing protein [Salinivirgaceae bacterium]
MSSWYSYENNISDHRPVGIKIVQNGTDIKTKKISKISVYPNPINNYAIFQFYENIEIKKIEIYNSLGVSVFVGIDCNGKNTYELNTSAFTSGIYFVKIFIDNEIIQAVKFIVE